jgi:Aerotolerance regulator N-terminal
LLALRARVAEDEDDMVEWFLNPQFLAAAAALVSVPIIIHLINRMRFKRIRWAAMEFLLKAQKRNRRRLIIEQLLLLLLRCLLVALAGLLVLRLSLNFADFAGKQNIHIVLLDDTLSMNDTWKENGVPRNSFQVAKNDVLLGNLFKNLSQISTNDRVILIPATKAALDSEFQPKTYDHLADGNKFNELKNDLENLPPTLLHANMYQAMKRVQEIVRNNIDHRVKLYIVSDFRRSDWARPQAEELHKIVQGMAADSRDMKILLIDVAHKAWAKGEQAVHSQDNIGIVDFRANTKVAGKGMPVTFTATIANFGDHEAELLASVFDDSMGVERLDIDFDRPMPLTLAPHGKSDHRHKDVETVKFDMRLQPNIKAGEPYFYRISLRLKSKQLGELEGDGLEADNTRLAAVEIRDKVPVLVIDGEGARSRTEFDKDSFFLRTALESVPSASYDFVWGDELGGGNAAKALERSDLAKFPSIFMLNVRDLSPKAVANLETYVRDGGGVAFFLGPQVNARAYNEKLYKDGRGIFPVPLKESYYPSSNDEPRRTEITGAPQLLLREDLFAGKSEEFPIFGNVFKEPEHKKFLQDLPVRRYFQVPRSQWQPEPGRTFELAALPNEAPVTAFQPTVLELVRGKLGKILEADEYKQYRGRAEVHRKNLESIVGPGSEKLAHQLAFGIDNLLLDPDAKKAKDQKDAISLEDFWKISDPQITTLKDRLEKLRDQVRYGDPLIVAGRFGQGRVVAMMTSLGKEWSDWAGGSKAMVVFQPFVWELQNYLSSQSSDENRTVGSEVRIVTDPEPYRGKQVKAIRTFYPPREPGKDAVVVAMGETFGVETKGELIFDFARHDKPGLYVTQLRTDDHESGKPPAAVYAHVFNVDTAKEGNLERVERGQITDNVIGGFKDRIAFEGPNVTGDAFVVRQSDFSESPWLYLIFLAVLVVEQALAVHLSFHLKGNEKELLTKMTPK